MHGRPIFFVLPGTITLIYDYDYDWYSSGDVLFGDVLTTDLGTFWSYTRGRFGLGTFSLDTELRILICMCPV